MGDEAKPPDAGAALIQRFKEWGDAVSHAKFAAMATALDEARRERDEARAKVRGDRLVEASLIALKAHAERMAMTLAKIADRIGTSGIEAEWAYEALSSYRKEHP